jgi:hypothetical protein
MSAHRLIPRPLAIGIAVLIGLALALVIIGRPSVNVRPVRPSALYSCRSEQKNEDPNEREIIAYPIGMPTATLPTGQDVPGYSVTCPV